MSEPSTIKQTDRLAAFRQEAAEFWQLLPNKTFFFLLLAGWLALFQWLGNSTFGYVDTPSLFAWMLNAYNASASEDSHGNLIPFVVLGLFWWKRQELRIVPKDIWGPALIGITAALIIHFLGYLIQQPRISIVAFFLGLYFLMGLAWGRRWLQAALFPFILFGFCIPVGSLAESITFPLRVVATHITVGFCHVILGINVIKDGVRIFDPNGSYSYEVAIACSGIRSAVALLALTTIYGFVTFKTWWKQLFFVVLAVPLAVIGNVARLTAIIFAAEAFGQQAGNIVHEWFGFVTFAIVLACILALGYWLREEKPVVGGESQA